MKHALDFLIHPQPTDSTCGPTCLHSVYRYWGDSLSLEQTIQEVGEMSIGGTLAVQLACHALQRGYDATVYSYNLQLFDPTWFSDPEIDLAEKLKHQLLVKGSQAGRGVMERERLRASTHAYLEFLRLGGQIRMPVLDENLIVDTLMQGRPILCGLSATFLYRECRERGHSWENPSVASIQDDTGGDPVGHFVVLYGFDRAKAQVLIADPLLSNPLGQEHTYATSIAKVSAAIFLGIVTYDANLLTLAPRKDHLGVVDGDHPCHGHE